MNNKPASTISVLTVFTVAAIIFLAMFFVVIFTSGG
jgi:hypothetical protein